jgi:hypothetical protein
MSNKRSREEAPQTEDEIVKRVTKEVLRSIQQEQPQHSASVEVKSQQKTVPVETLIDTFNGILRNVLHENGFKLVSSTDSLLQFNGIIPYPFDMNMDLSDEIKAAGKRLGGAAWCIYDAVPEGQLVKLYFTQDKALKVVKSEQDQKDDAERLYKLHNQPKPTDEAGRMSYDLVCHLAVDLKTKAKFSQRPVGDNMTVISATVLLAEPIRSHQLEKIAVYQGSKIKGLTWGKHQTLNKLRLTLDVTSPSMVDLSSQESLN